MQSVILKPGPRLVLVDDDVDVTTTAHEHLFSSVLVEDGVLLRDVFRLIAPNPFLLGVYRQGYAKELCEEALKGPLKPSGEMLEYIELAPCWTLHTRAKTFETVGTYDVTGVSELAKADVYVQNTLICPKGSRAAYGLSLSPLRALLLLPIRVKSSVIIHEADMDSRNFTSPVKGAQEYTIPGPTLGQLFREILFELSWHGTPEQTERTAQAAQDVFEQGAVLTAPSDFTDKVLQALGVVPQEALFDSVFSQWRPRSPRDIYAALDSFEDDAKVGPALMAVFNGLVVSRPDFADLDACVFRQMLREARIPL